MKTTFPLLLLLGAFFLGVPGNLLSRPEIKSPVIIDVKLTNKWGGEGTSISLAYATTSKATTLLRDNDKIPLYSMVAETYDVVSYDLTHATIKVHLVKMHGGSGDLAKYHSTVTVTPEKPAVTHPFEGATLELSMRMAHP